MKDIKTVYELTSEELDELRLYMLYDDENEFYEDIDEISDSDIYARFADRLFRDKDFAWNQTGRHAPEGVAA